MTEKIMSLEEFMMIKEASVEAEETGETPVLIQKDEELLIARDPNKTEIKMGDYTLVFILPEADLPNYSKKLAGAKVLGKDSTGNLVKVEKTFTNRYIVPRKQGNILMTFNLITPYLKPVLENGEFTDLDNAEWAEILTAGNHILSNSIYNIIAEFLDIYELIDNALQEGVFQSFAKLLKQHPELYNTADSFTS